MSDDIIVAIIGGITTIIAAAIVPILEKRLDADSQKQSKITVTGNQLSAKKRRGKHFRVSVFWFIPIGVAFLTLIVFLGVQHEARQNVKKILADSPEFHMNMGDQYAAMGDFASAELEYYEAIEDDQSDALAHDKRAVALAKDGRLEEALEENMTACALAPDVAQYHNNKGVTLYEMGVRQIWEGNDKAGKQYYKNAVEAHRIAVKLESEISDYHYNLSKALSRNSISDMDDAIAECAIALQLNPENSEYHSLYASLFLFKGQFDEALNEALKAIKKDSNNAEAHAVLGLIFDFSNQSEAALSAYRQASQLNPEKYHSFLGGTLYDLGRYREALKEFETDITLTPYLYGQSWDYYFATKALIALNRYEEALQYVEKGIELYPDLPYNHYLRYALLTYFNRHEEAEQERQAAYDLGLSEDADASI